MTRCAVIFNTTGKISRVELNQTLALVRDGGSLFLLVIAIVGGFRGWYVPRWTFDAHMQAADKSFAEMKQDRDEWKELAMRGLSVMEQGVRFRNGT